MDGFHGIYLCILGRSGASGGGSPDLIGVKLQLVKLSMEDSLVNVQT